MPRNGITDFSNVESSIVSKGIDLQEQPFDAQGFPSLGYGDLMGYGPSTPGLPPNINWFQEYGTTGLMYVPPYVYEEWLEQLQYTRGVRKWKEMRDMDAVISAIWYTVEMICRSVNFWWEIDGQRDSNGNLQDPELAKSITFYEQCWEDMSTSWEDTLPDILSCGVFGYSIAEIVYKKREGPHPEDSTLDSNYDDGRIGWRKLAPRAQETLLNWHFDEHGGIRGFRQLAPPKFQITEIPIEKMLLFRIKPRKGNPEGVSLFRGAYRAYEFKKLLEEIEMVGYERDLAGVPVIRAPGEVITGVDPTSTAMMQLLTRYVRNLKRNQDEGYVLPSNSFPPERGGGQMYSIELLGPQSQRQLLPDVGIQRYNKLIAMSVLADFLMLGQDTTGSYALAETRNNLFSLSITAILDSICSVINSYAVPRLAQMNPDINPSSLPRLVHGEVASSELSDLGIFLNNVARGGVAIPDDVQFRNALWRLAHLPLEPEPDAPGTTPVDSLLPGQVPARRRERAQPLNEETPYPGAYTLAGTPGTTVPAQTAKSEPTSTDVHVNSPTDEFSVAYIQGTQPKGKKKKRANKVQKIQSLEQRIATLVKMLTEA